MTKINIYCLYDREQALYGVYSSLKAVHRDAVKLCNCGISPVLVESAGNSQPASLTLLRNIFKGEMDTKVIYRSDASRAVILKTKLRE
tara:strand:+ start:1567 stop:1830 length:264 start_codon:yes stop_codon:yes gene_type:complete